MARDSKAITQSEKAAFERAADTNANGGIFMANIINTPRDRARALERENIALRRDLERAQATTEYLAMMADIDIEDAEDENDEKDV